MNPETMLNHPYLASPTLISIIKYLQTIPNPVEYLKNNISDFCSALNIPKDYDNIQQLTQVLEMLLFSMAIEPVGEDASLCYEYLNNSTSTILKQNTMLPPSSNYRSLTVSPTPNTPQQSSFPSSSSPFNVASSMSSRHATCDNTLSKCAQHENRLLVFKTSPLNDAPEPVEPSNLYYLSFHAADDVKNNSLPQNSYLANSNSSLHFIAMHNFSNVSPTTPLDIQEAAQQENMQSYSLPLQRPSASTITTVSTTPPSSSSFSSCSSDYRSYCPNYPKSFHNNVDHFSNIVSEYSLPEESYNGTKVEEFCEESSRYTIGKPFGILSFPNMPATVPKNKVSLNDFSIPAGASLRQHEEKHLRGQVANSATEDATTSWQAQPKATPNLIENSAQNKYPPLEQLVDQFSLEEKVYFTQALSKCGTAFLRLYSVLEQTMLEKTPPKETNDSTTPKPSSKEIHWNQGVEYPFPKYDSSNIKHSTTHILRLIDNLRDTIVSFLGACPPKAFVFFSVLILREFQLFKSTFQSTSADPDSCLVLTISMISNLFLGRPEKKTEQSPDRGSSTNNSHSDNLPLRTTSFKKDTVTKPFYTDTPPTRSPSTERSDEAFLGKTRRRPRRRLMHRIKRNAVSQYKIYPSTVASSSNSLLSEPDRCVTAVKTKSTKEQNQETKTSNDSAPDSPTPCDTSNILDACLEDQLMQRIPSHLYRELPQRYNNPSNLNTANLSVSSPSSESVEKKTNKTSSGCSYAAQGHRFAKDEILLKLPDHIITRTGVVLPPAGSGLYLSKVVGVVWDKIHNSWVVNYTLLGRRYFQHFPAKKYGFLEGRRRAIELRLEKDNEKAAVEGNIRGGGRRAQIARQHLGHSKSRRALSGVSDHTSSKNSEMSELSLQSGRRKRNEKESDIFTTASAEMTSQIKGTTRQRDTTGMYSSASKRQASCPTENSEVQLEQKEEDIVSKNPETVEHPCCFPTNRTSDIISDTTSDFDFLVKNSFKPSVSDSASEEISSKDHLMNKTSPLMTNQFPAASNLQSAVFTNGYFGPDNLTLGIHPDTVYDSHVSHMSQKTATHYTPSIQPNTAPVVVASTQQHLPEPLPPSNYSFPTTLSNESPLRSMLRENGNYFGVTTDTFMQQSLIHSQEEPIYEFNQDIKHSFPNDQESFQTSVADCPFTSPQDLTVHNLLAPFSPSQVTINKSVPTLEPSAHPNPCVIGLPYTNCPNLMEKVNSTGADARNHSFNPPLGVENSSSKNFNITSQEHRQITTNDDL